MNIKEMARSAKKAALELAAASAELKNDALQKTAQALLENTAAIIKANEADLARSKKANLAKPLLERLKFDEGKIRDVTDGIESLIRLPEPVGQSLSVTELDRGLELHKVSCPIGVIGVIFESRPDALVQISTLCLKSGNAVILKGGSEAAETNKILAEIISQSAIKAGIPSGWLQLVETREDVNEMLKMDEYIDLMIPRGSNAFVKYIMDNSNIPVLGHSDGICHTYVHSDADIEMAIKVIIDAKTQYSAACNATETILVNKNIANKFLPLLKQRLEEVNVELFGCKGTLEIIDIKPVPADNWAKEYLDRKVSVKIVTGDNEAIDHINTYGSGHTDAIITADKATAQKFMNLVDSGSTFWNCSTRFSDGFRYGFGAEVGISTSKIHSRGPVGLEGLLIYKYMLTGNGHIVADYAGKKKSFTHVKIK